MDLRKNKIKIVNTPYDRRVKLTSEQRSEIKYLYAQGGTSYSKLAKEFNVSKRLIQFIINPDKHNKCLEQFKERRKDGRYKPTKEDWASTMREHRSYKEKLFKEGKI